MTTKPPTDLMSVAELAQEFGMGESTVWLHLKRHDIPRFRVPIYGKRTMISRRDFERLVTTPIQIEPPAKKAATRNDRAAA